MVRASHGVDRGLHGRVELDTGRLPRVRDHVAYLPDVTRDDESDAAGFEVLGELRRQRGRRVIRRRTRARSHGPAESRTSGSRDDRDGAQRDADGERERLPDRAVIYSSAAGVSFSAPQVV
jgi:hypothetical protein